nr:CFI-box-CTERM domain-containing protein [Leucobacter sp. cx-42]
MALLVRADQGLISREELLRRIRHTKSLYSECQRLSGQANWVNQQYLVVDYPKRLEELTIFEQGIDRFINRDSHASAQQSSQNSGGCYIATAVYGSYDDPSVLVLRQFRDEKLQTSMLGRVFIRTYYAISPPLARHFSSVQWLKIASKKVLDRIVRSVSRTQ